MAVPIDLNRHPANNTGSAVPYDTQDSNAQALNGPLSAIRNLTRASAASVGLRKAVPPHNRYLAASSIPPRTPQNQYPCANATKQCEKKTGFPYVCLDVSFISQKHKATKESCLFFSPFTWPRVDHTRKETTCGSYTRRSHSPKSDNLRQVMTWGSSRAGQRECSSELLLWENLLPLI